MRKSLLALATAATLGATAIAAPALAEARGGFFPALAGGLIAGAVIGGIASSAYAYGPGYGYYDGYGPGYYGGYGYAPAYYGGYSAAYYDDYAPYYGYRYRRVIRPAFAYYGGPRYYGGWHHRWLRDW
jgi:hypothetical protein